MNSALKYTALIYFVLLTLTSHSIAADRVYSAVPHLNVREKPTTKSKIMGILPLGRWVTVIDKNHEWTEVRINSEVTGYVFNKLVSHIWIKVWKKQRKLFLMSGNSVLKTYPVSLGFNPHDDKVKKGDGRTPLGRFFICEMSAAPEPKEKYGARSMRISYPNREDARRGLRDKLITKSEYLFILKRIDRGEMPPQNTVLGGSIRIHGGGTGKDWTLGCIAMKDEDIIELFSMIPSRKTLVDIYRDKGEDYKISKEGYINEKVLMAAKELMKTGCKYTKEAMGIIKIGYPMGDIDPQIGVCTDVIIRSLRGAGIDLQALLHEDIVLNSERYPNIAKPDTNIDHRRTRNLKIWFDHHAVRLSTLAPSLTGRLWQPGDIVILDTGIQNGTIYDHIGIVSDSRVENRSMVINLWTINYTINEMDLLNGKYPIIVGHYRLMHPFDYNALLDTRK